MSVFMRANEFKDHRAMVLAAADPAVIILLILILQYYYNWRGVYCIESLVEAIRGDRVLYGSYNTVAVSVLN